MFKNIYTTRMSGNSKVLEKRFEKINTKPIRLKKLVSLICTIIILSVFTVGTMVMAEIDGEGQYTLEITNNGEVIELENKPFIEDGVVYVPLRELFEKLGLMEGEFAKMDWDNGVVLISLSQKNLNEGVQAEYTSYLYKIEIGKSELVVNPEILMHRNYPDEVTSVVEPMDNAPILKRNITYIPFSYAERMAERADLGLLSPPDLYKLEVLYSGETLAIAYPIQGYYEITQGFGRRVHPITGEETFHTGIDFKAEEGTPVIAGIEGNFNVGYDAEKGAYLSIFGKNGVEVTYCNLDSEILQTLWNVMWTPKGNVIGYVGNTGMSTGPHLHMEMKINGEYVNPQLYLTENNYDKLILMLKTDIPNVLAEGGYPNAEYTITDVDYLGNAFAMIKVELKNYDNKIVSIMYYYYENTPYEWVGYVLPESYNDFNF
ncbi:MAG: peptidoglycan DD-metalloendopeptidase family protein [Clostridia bacterium]|nr:peptidoglycan DD-metalloendopeptidase family protein [Clostridia bacterium]